MTEYVQHTNQMTVEVTTLDGSPTYSLAQEYLMDHVAAAYREMTAEGLLVRLRLLDSDGVSVLDLDGLDPDASALWGEDAPHDEDPDGSCSDTCVALHPAHAETRGADGTNMRAEDMDRDADGHLTDVGREQLGEYAVAHGLVDPS